MSGSARRDLATLEPWEASLARSRARRRRDAVRTARRGGGSKLALVRGGWDPMSLAALIDARREAARDLAEREPWDLSLGRSRARRRAAKLRFVPASSRARRLSLGALVALTAGPAAALLDSGGGVATAGAAPTELDPITTTTHQIVLSAGSEGRQVRLLQRALGIAVDGVYGSETEAAVRRFQSTRGLTVDGIVGARTSHALAVHAPPVLSGAAVLRNLSGEASEPAPGEVREVLSSPGAGGMLAVADTAPRRRRLRGWCGSGRRGCRRRCGKPRAAEIAGGQRWDRGARRLRRVRHRRRRPPRKRRLPPQVRTGTKPVAPRSPPAPGPPATTGPRRSSKARPTLRPVKRMRPAPAKKPPAERASAWVLQARARNAPRRSMPALAATGMLAGGERHPASVTTDAVERLQASLHVAVDGEFGPETERAIRSFQTAHGLTVDGVAGPATWQALGAHSQPEADSSPLRAAGRERDIRRPRRRRARGWHHRRAGADGHADRWRARGRCGLREWPRPPLPRRRHTTPAGSAARLRGRRIRPRHRGGGAPLPGRPRPRSRRRRRPRHLGRARHSPALRSCTADPAYFPHPTPAAGGGATSTAGGAGAPGATSSSAEAIVARVIAAADEIATRPYVYGGGHGSFISEGYDCSGSVSYALHGGGLLAAPEDSTGLESYGEAGPGRYITIYANAEHAWMTIDGRRYDTVALAEDGSRWGGPSDDGGGFVERHPDGL